MVCHKWSPNHIIVDYLEWESQSLLICWSLELENSCIICLQLNCLFCLFFSLIIFYCFNTCNSWDRLHIMCNFWLYALLQEVKEARQRYESRLIEVDSGRKEEYDYKLTEALADMRAQNEDQIKIYKDNIESTYITKVWTHYCMLSMSIRIYVNALTENKLFCLYFPPESDRKRYEQWLFLTADSKYEGTLQPKQHSTAKAWTICFVMNILTPLALA